VKKDALLLGPRYTEHPDWASQDTGGNENGPFVEKAQLSTIVKCYYPFITL
jgi:hypothetical protein